MEIITRSSAHLIIMANNFADSTMETITTNKEGDPHNKIGTGEINNITITMVHPHQTIHR